VNNGNRAVATVGAVLLSGVMWSEPLAGNAVEVNADQIGCSVLTTKSHLVLGDYPTATVQIRNNSSHSTILVGSLDGSSRLGRYPHAYFEVKGPEGGVHTMGLPTCGLLNPLRAEDFVVLQPGASFNPHESGAGSGFVPDTSLGRVTLSEPGEYTLVFHYSTDEVDPSRWQGSTSPIHAEIVEKLRRVPRVTISCSTMLTVE